MFDSARTKPTISDDASAGTHHLLTRDIDQQQGRPVACFLSVPWYLELSGSTYRQHFPILLRDKLKTVPWSNLLLVRVNYFYSES